MLFIRNFKCYTLLVAVFILTACGGDGNLIAGGSIGGGNNGAAFVVVEAVDQSGKTSFASNEVSVSTLAAGATISWSEPTRKVGDTCITDTPLSYRIGVSEERGSYTYVESNELSNFGTLACSNTSNSDALCGVSISSCTYTLSSSPLPL